MLQNKMCKDKLLARSLAELVSKEGGTAYYVGGYVRDKLLGKESKDIDIEVHGITPEKLYTILKQLGDPLSFGNSFGIYNLRHHDIDISLPRRDNNGRDSLSDEYTDPFIGTERAASRRDLTINALMENVLTGEIIDHFGGREDLEKGIIRHISAESFSEDPLRVLRAAQLAARFGFTVSDETIKLSKSLSLEDIPKERIFTELEKALLKSDKPSVFFDTLRKMNQLSLYFPEVEALIGIPQDPTHHPEGDAWAHTMQVIDSAALLRKKAEKPLSFMLSALCHDLGKAVTTTVTDGRVHSYKHESEGVGIAIRLLERLTGTVWLKEYVANMVLLHMKPRQMALQKASAKSMCRMLDEAISAPDLLLLSKADSLFRTDEKILSETEEILNNSLSLYKERISAPQVTGQDLIASGLAPGKDFSDALSFSRKLQLSGMKKEEALKHTISYIKKNRSEENE